jgi:hypothetical protein
MGITNGMNRYLYQKSIMKKGLAAILGLFLVISASAQKEISMDSLSQHIGDSITVCTKIYGGIYLDKSKDSITLLNAGAAYPNAPLTILIKIDARKEFKEYAEVFFKDKEVCISGKIILYKEKPEIIVYDEKQMVLK